MTLITTMAVRELPVGEKAAAVWVELSLAEIIRLTDRCCGGIAELVLCVACDGIEGHWITKQ